MDKPLAEVLSAIPIEEISAITEPNSYKVVVDFTASWCGPCRIMAPVFVEMAKKMPNVLFLKVDVDELQSVSVEWEVEAMPTFLLLKEGQVVDKVVGADKEQLQTLIAKHATDAAAA